MSLILRGINLLGKQTQQVKHSKPNTVSEEKSHLREDQVFSSVMIIPNNDLEGVIEQLHQTPHMLVYEFAGAGVQALAWLHAVAGSSATILEANDRYSQTSFVESVGFQPTKFVSLEASEALAKQALKRAKHLKRTGAAALGVSCTASIATNRPKRGEHHCYISVADDLAVSSYALIFDKGARNREEEETLVSILVLKAIAEICNLTPPALNLSTQDVLKKHHNPGTALLELENQKVNWLQFTSRGEVSTGQQFSHQLLLSGSFNPVHAGHLELVHLVAEQKKQTVCFELPLVNAAKATIDSEEAVRRARQFIGKGNIILSLSPLFYEKALLFPNSIFIVGADTAVRLIDKRFYTDNEQHMLNSFKTIREAGCSFIVAGRLIDGDFVTLDEITLPEAIKNLFEVLPEEVFRVDLSSTEIRKNNSAK